MLHRKNAQIFCKLHQTIFVRLPCCCYSAAHVKFSMRFLKVCKKCEEHQKSSKICMQLRPRRLTKRSNTVKVAQVNLLAVELETTCITQMKLSASFDYFRKKLFDKIARGVQAVLHENRSYFHMKLLAELPLVLKIIYILFSSEITCS